MYRLTLSFAVLALALASFAPASAQRRSPDRLRAQPVATDTIPTRNASLRFNVRSLLVPVEGVSPEDIDNTFTARRSGGRVHRAVDIMAPHGTPALAISDGEITRIHTNRLGGKVLYLRSADGSHDFYYAHLDRYYPGIRVGSIVRQGDVIGYVGNTGNARTTPPHLHFQILRRSGSGRGTPVNPYTVFHQSDLYGSEGGRVRG